MLICLPDWKKVFHHNKGKLVLVKSSDEVNLSLQLLHLLFILQQAFTIISYTEQLTTLMQHCMPSICAISGGSISLQLVTRLVSRSVVLHMMMMMMHN